MFNWLFYRSKKSVYDPYRQQIEDYLAEAYDLVDLERRQRQIDRGQAPWQRYNSNLKGWV